MSTSIVRRNENITAIAGYMKQRQAQLAAVCGAGVEEARARRVLLHAILRNEKLAACTPESVYGCFFEALSLGLEPFVGGQAYLVPFKDKATLIIGYGGMIALARESGLVNSIKAVRVYSMEEFTLDASRLLPVMGHKPLPPASRGELLGVYSVVEPARGETWGIWLWKEEVDARRARSRAKDSGPWVTDYDAMAMKTVIRETAKFLPRRGRLAKAVDLDEQVEIIDADQDFDVDAEAARLLPDEPVEGPPVDALPSDADPAPAAPEPMTPERIEVLMQSLANEMSTVKPEAVRRLAKRFGFNSKADIRDWLTSGAWGAENVNDLLVAIKDERQLTAAASGAKV